MKNLFEVIHKILRRIFHKFLVNWTNQRTGIPYQGQVYIYSPSTQDSPLPEKSRFISWQSEHCTSSIHSVSVRSSNYIKWSPEISIYGKICCFYTSQYTIILHPCTSILICLLDQHLCFFMLSFQAKAGKKSADLWYEVL